MIYQKLKGTVDWLPPQSQKWRLFQQKICNHFEKSGFSFIETPYLEKTALFARGTGEASEVVQKQMYSFLDKNEESITLRPEATPSIVRSYIENKIYGNKGVEKYYYFGPMFRYERPQRGRQRQFFQYGVEIIGTQDAKSDAETIAAFSYLYQSLHIDNQLRLNSIGCFQCRPPYLEKLKKYLIQNKSSLCEECKVRVEKNPLRSFDCKKEPCQKTLEKAPFILHDLCESCKTHFLEVQNYLKYLGITYDILPKLVRGLDYYTKTAFEFASTKLGAQDALSGGGRYDELIKVLGGPETSAVGCAGGFERLLLVVEEEAPKREGVFMASLGEEAEKEGLKIVTELRNEGIRCLLSYDHKSLKSQMRQADSAYVKFVCILGENELRSRKVMVKDMEKSTQEEVSLADLKGYLDQHV